MRNTDTTDTPNDRDARIVALTLAGKQPAAVAVETDCAVSTVYRRLQTPAVRRALAEARAAEVRPLVAQAVGEVKSTVERLVAVRDAATTRDGDRIKACIALLDWFKGIWQLGEVLPRIAAIEATLAAANDARDTDATHPNNHNRTMGPVPTGLIADDDTELA